MPMINEKQPLKTQEEQVEFINRFADIVKDNGKLRNNYKISFGHTVTANDVVIADINGKSMDLKKLMPKQEYAECIALLYRWKRA